MEQFSLSHDIVQIPRIVKTKKNKDNMDPERTKCQGPDRCVSEWIPVHHTGVFVSDPVELRRLSPVKQEEPGTKCYQSCSCSAGGRVEDGR